MSLTLGIRIGDVLVASSSSGGELISLHFKQGEEVCGTSTLIFHIQDYFHSPEWRVKNYGYYMLHAAANLSLDMIIVQCGRGGVQKRMTP